MHFPGFIRSRFSAPPPHRVHRLRTQRRPLPPVPRPTRLLLPAHGHLRCPPLLRGSLRSSFPHVFAISSDFFRAWIEKDKYGVYPGVLSSLSRSGCPELSPPPPRPQQPWVPGVVFPTPVHSTRSRPLHRPGCMLGCRRHLAGNLPGSSSPESPRLDTVAAPPPHTRRSQDHAMGIRSGLSADLGEASHHLH